MLSFFWWVEIHKAQSVLLETELSRTLTMDIYNLSGFACISMKNFPRKHEVFSASFRRCRLLWIWIVNFNQCVKKSPTTIHLGMNIECLQLSYVGCHVQGGQRCMISVLPPTADQRRLTAWPIIANAYYGSASSCYVVTVTNYPKSWVVCPRVMQNR